MLWLPEKKGERKEYVKFTLRNLASYFSALFPNLPHPCHLRALTKQSKLCIFIKTLHMKCPNCDATLQMTERQGVEIDYCPNCRGIWLDKGELEKILDRAASHYSQRPNYEKDFQQYGYGEDYEKKHQGRKKRSFFSDFFDFD